MSKLSGARTSRSTEQSEEPAEPAAETAPVKFVGGAAPAIAETGGGEQEPSASEQAYGDDDDVIQVSTNGTPTPRERAKDVLSASTAADARAAKLEATRPKFRPRLERRYQDFCRAYDLADSPETRVEFADYLGSGNLGARAKQRTEGQQATTAKKVLFSTTKPGVPVSAHAVGMREALDPRQPLADDERAQLATLTLDDGRNALDARTEAEKLWATKRIVTTVDVPAAYASGNPHLAAFESAARDAGYTPQEIAMVTANARPDQLWRSDDTKAAMPATLDDFKKQFGDGRQRGFTLDANRLEDARAAIAQGMTLAQFDAARTAQGFSAGPVAPGTFHELADLRDIDWDHPLGTCGTVSVTLGLVTGTLLRCSNGKSYFGAGVTTAAGVGGDAGGLKVFGRRGVTVEDVITGNSLGLSGTAPLYGLAGTNYAISGNYSGYVISGSGSVGLTVPAGVSWTDTVELGNGLPFVTSTAHSTSWVLADQRLFAKPRRELRADLERWPTESNRLARGLYEYLVTGGATDFGYHLPSELEAKWQSAPQRARIVELVRAKGGVDALTREQRWSELGPAMKGAAVEFFNAEVADWAPKTPE